MIDLIGGALVVLAYVIGWWLGRREGYAEGRADGLEQAADILDESIEALEEQL